MSPTPTHHRTRQRQRRRLDGDDGLIGGADGLIFGVMVFLVGSLLVANVWSVIDAKLAVTAAAKEATRAFVEAPNGETGFAEAEAAATQVVAGHGRAPDRLTITAEPGTTFVRCAPAGFTVAYQLDLIAIPFLGGTGRGFTVAATHRERVDPFRSGVTNPTGTLEEACG